ncbi:amino acid ABC transporter permease [Pseudomonas sp. zfem002]|uniref:amino acid ABC transporter permease n=1 Tax=Pseudomonas sp. zfem002 TaxID=3078197 RepID=UPI00292900C5|nr:amino acid ABC transporter permease [Pseudomonas sp. zfem002]MDU9394697.1 amino acid ABC transporter permease [Pseudomonas sp. zfem002]
MTEPDLRLWLQEHGLTLSVLWDPTDRERLLAGLGLTLLMAVVAGLASLLIAALGVAAQRSPRRWLSGLVDGYVALWRSTPLLVQLFFFYFGLGALLPLTVGDDGSQVRLLGGTGWAIIAIALYSGAFQIEALRAGIDTVPRGIHESAAALGLHGLPLWRHILLPLALRNSLPAVGNNLVQTLKATSVAYAVAAPELLYAANRIWSERFNVGEMMQVLLLTWLLLIGTCSWLLGRLEAHLQLPGQEARDVR